MWCFVYILCYLVTRYFVCEDVRLFIFLSKYSCFKACQLIFLYSFAFIFNTIDNISDAKILANLNCHLGVINYIPLKYLGLKCNMYNTCTKS